MFACAAHIELGTADRGKPLADLLRVAAEGEPELKQDAGLLREEVAGADDTGGAGIISAFATRTRGGDENNAVLNGFRPGVLLCAGNIARPEAGRDDALGTGRDRAGDGSEGGFDRSVRDVHERELIGCRASEIEWWLPRVGPAGHHTRWCTQRANMVFVHHPESAV